MKKFSTAKILSLVFVCVMLLGALTLTAFAAEDENLDIVFANVTYGDTYQIMFAVDAPEGATVKATDSEGNEINVVPFDADEISYQAYILTEGVAAQAIDEVITLSVEYNGKTVSKNYSVLRYVYQRINVLKNKEDADEKELAELDMLNSLLDYAVKANAFFNGATENSFDKYKLVSATGVTVNGIAPSGMYAPGVAPFANIDAIEYDAENYELVVMINGEASSLEALKALTVGTEDVTVSVEVVEKAHQHSYTSKVTDPTCTEAGYTTFTCECGDSYTEPGEPATGHSYTDGVCGVCGESDPDYAVEMTITEALAAELGTKVIVSGTVCEINTPWSDSFGNISVYIIDESGAKILCYRMKTDVVKGDIITVTGEIGEFNGAIQIVNSTAEITGHDESYDVAASEVNIEEALALPDGTDIVVTGTVIRIDGAWNSSYGNMNVTIKDETGKTLYLYRLATQVNLNDVVKVTGSMATYGGARQVGAGATAEVVGTHECTEFTDATCLELSACVLCGKTTGELAEHTMVDGECSVCGHKEGAAEAQKFTASQTMEDLIAANGWTGTTTKQSFNLDDKVSVKVDGGSNTGKAYDGNHIRIYATDSPAGTLTINVAEGYELVSVKVTTVTGTYAFLCVEGTTTDICNETVSVSGSSVLLQSVKNGSNGKQVRVLSIEVVYQEVV